jgi:hypothetical protein
MFKILGSDGKEYGPISTEQVCQWLREGRAGAPTLAQRGGTAEWLPLSALPEFAELLRPPDPVAGTDELPYAVRLLARLMFVVAGLSLILLLISMAGIFTAMSHGNYRPSPLHYVSWVSGWGVAANGRVRWPSIFRWRCWPSARGVSSAHLERWPAPRCGRRWCGPRCSCSPPRSASRCFCLTSPRSWC